MFESRYTLQDESNFEEGKRPGDHNLQKITDPNTKTAIFTLNIDKSNNSDPKHLNMVAYRLAKAMKQARDLGQEIVAVSLQEMSSDPATRRFFTQQLYDHLRKLGFPDNDFKWGADNQIKRESDGQFLMTLTRGERIRNAKIDDFNKRWGGQALLTISSIAPNTADSKTHAIVNIHRNHENGIDLALMNNALKQISDDLAIPITVVGDSNLSEEEFFERYYPGTTPDEKKDMDYLHAPANSSIIPKKDDENNPMDKFHTGFQGGSVDLCYTIYSDEAPKLALDKTITQVDDYSNMALWNDVPELPVVVDSKTKKIDEHAIPQLYSNATHRNNLKNFILTNMRTQFWEDGSKTNGITLPYEGGQIEIRFPKGERYGSEQKIINPFPKDGNFKENSTKKRSSFFFEYTLGGDKPTTERAKVTWGDDGFRFQVKSSAGAKIAAQLEFTMLMKAYFPEVNVNQALSEGKSLKEYAQQISVYNSGTYKKEFDEVLKGYGVRILAEPPQPGVPGKLADPGKPGGGNTPPPAPPGMPGFGAH